MWLCIKQNKSLNVPIYLAYARKLYGEIELKKYYWKPYFW